MSDVPTLTLLLVEASPLISLLKVARFDLLDIFGLPLACTDFVRGEIRREEQRGLLDALIGSGRLREIPIEEPSHLVEVEALFARGLGRGEGSSIVLAASRGYALVMDDKRARKMAVERGITMYTTAEMIVENIRTGVLTVQEADGLIGAWKEQGEFPVTVGSFRELLERG